MRESMTNDGDISPLALIKKQRSHVLFVLSNAKGGCEADFLGWYQGIYRKAVSDFVGVLRVQHYEQHEVDVTVGRYPRLPFHYLALYELSLDGAQEAESLIERIGALHREQASAQAPATWLYYPVSEKVGRSSVESPSMLTLAFANSVPGREGEFREWYATRHIRHALNISTLVGGQCFERAQFQRPGASEAIFSTIAVYEQEGTPEAMIESVASLPESTFHFPVLDTSRFSESLYRPVGMK